MLPSLLHYTLAPCHAQIFCASQEATRNFPSINRPRKGTDNAAVAAHTDKPAARVTRGSQRVAENAKHASHFTNRAS